MRQGYGYMLRSDNSGTAWLIYKGSIHSPKIVFRHPYLAAEDGPEPPEAIRTEYERLTGRTSVKPETVTLPTRTSNIVEMVTDDSAFDQPCAYGNRVESHAVYCHNDWWLYSPRKCHRTWYTGGERRDEDCPGYMPNPRRKDETASE